MADNNPWLAIDAATVPEDRAEQLRRSWEGFVTEGRLDAVRTPIAHSWQRSHAAGVDPSADHVAPVLADADEASARWQAHPLAAAAAVIAGILGPIAEASEHLIVVSDADGLLLWMGGNRRVSTTAAEEMNFTVGAGWQEGQAGTNAIGTALAVDHAVQVFAAEHFNEVVQRWTCAAAPVHDPDTDALLGVIDLTGRASMVHAHSLAVAMATAEAVEAQLRIVMQEHDARLRRRHEDRVGTGARRALITPSGRLIAGDLDSGWTGAARVVVPPGGGEILLPSGVVAFAEPVGHEEAFVLRTVGGDRSRGRRPIMKVQLLGRDHAGVTLDGHPLQLGRRHAEILALLSARPGGMTADELATDLYGDAGHPGTVRVQVHRLRKLLGEWIDTDPYRLSLEVESDVARLRGLLDRGAVREAAECYCGPLLPHSEAPGVVREREALEAWVRQAVLTAEDEDALWAWLQSPSGEDDALAWRRLLARLDYTDPRRSFAAARVATLRSALSVDGRG